MEQITCDLIPGGKMPLLHASQYDEGREYRINLTENKQAYTLDGTELLTVSVRKGDNTLFTADIANTFGGKSYVDFVSTEQMCAVAGYNFGELSITKNNTRIGTVNFMLVCEPSPEADFPSDSDIKNLNRRIDDHIDEVLPDMVEEVAEPIINEKVPEKVAELVPSAVATAAGEIVPPLVNELVPEKVSEVAPSIVASLVPAEVASIAPSVLAEVAPPIVSALVPEAVGDNYYNKTQTDAKIAALIDDSQSSESKAYSSEKTESLIDSLYPIENVSGLIANFFTSLARPLVNVKANIGYNASGVNTVNIYKRGANLFDEQMEKGTYNTANGNKSASNANLRTKNKIKVKPNTTICFVTDYPSTSVVGILFRYGIDGSYLGYNAFYGGAYLYTIPNDTYEIAFYTASGYGTTYRGISVNYPSTDTTYHAYNGSELTIDVSGHSLYGGYIEITPESAKLTSNKNADGTDKTPEVFDLSGVSDINANSGVNNIFTDDDNLIGCYYYVLDKESKDRKDRQALKFVYVSPNGSDDNDGLTPDTPVATFTKAITIGKKIRAYRGTYNEAVYLANVDDFSIEPYDNNDTYSTSNPKRAKIVINGNVNTDCTFRMDNCNNVFFEDVSFNTAKKSVVRIYDCNNVVMNNCEANGAIESMGYEVADSDVIFNNCYASQNRYDGFNFHGYGTTIMNDCVSENNQDDGCSHHEGCIGTINGGRFSNNGKAGIAPAYGAQVNIYNAICNGNPYGIAYLSDNTGHANMEGIISSCLMLGNSIGLRVQALCTVTSVNSKYSGNTTDKDITGTLNEY